jgi:hypothetical protein
MQGLRTGVTLTTRRRRCVVLMRAMVIRWSNNSFESGSDAETFA